LSITNGYCTAEDLRQRLGITDTDDEQIFENVIEAVSRSIDNYCRRRFYATSETRVYTARCETYIRVDDLLTVTTLKTDATGDRVYETTWATTDYDLDPANASLDGRPYTKVCVSPLGRYRFPTSHTRGVQIVGSFGYASTTPDVVNEACLIQAARIFRRKDSPFGVAGTPEFGQLRLLSRLDPDVELLVAPLRRQLSA
jgi:hypothetical protein